MWHKAGNFPAERPALALNELPIKHVQRVFDCPDKTRAGEVPGSGCGALFRKTGFPERSRSAMVTFPKQHSPLKGGLCNQNINLTAPGQHHPRRHLFRP
jgi:hypothetical protein